MVLRPPVMSAFVERNHPSNIPDDAVYLTRDDAVQRQWKFIREWKYPRDVWPFTFGLGSLSFATAISSLMIASHFRKKLKLKHYGRIPMFITSAFIPSFMTLFGHSKFVTEEVLLQNECPVCIQVRAVATQTICGIAYPYILSPLAAFGFCSVYATYRIPLFKKENLGEIFQLWKKLSRSLHGRLLLMWAAHVAIAVTITNAEARSLFHIYKKAKIERDMEDQIAL